jgi:hypothetical protein
MGNMLAAVLAVILLLGGIALFVLAFMVSTSVAGWVFFLGILAITASLGLPVFLLERSDNS